MSQSTRCLFFLFVSVVGFVIILLLHLNVTCIGCRWLDKKVLLVSQLITVFIFCFSQNICNIDIRYIDITEDVFGWPERHQRWKQASSQPRGSTKGELIFEKGRRMLKYMPFVVGTTTMVNQGRVDVGKREKEGIEFLPPVKQG